VDPTDAWSVRTYGDVSMEFNADGTLIYTVNLETKQQIMQMTYRVEGSHLVTDQPSSPREERTEFLLAEDGRLVLTNAPPAPPTVFVRRM
jgi:hypothetical protein